jgi:hypothetical protein
MNAREKTRAERSPAFFARSSFRRPSKGEDAIILNVNGGSLRAV